MAKRNIFRSVAAVLAFGMCMTGLAGCGSEKRADGKTEIEVVSYKPEAVKAFEKIEKRFNETHDDIHLTISSPNEAMTILKTRFIREDYPDIIAIGGDINYSNFLDADLFDDISDLDEVQTVKQAYLDMDKELEFIPKDGTYALPYVANAAGILYNKDLFEENAWKVPTTWQEFTTLCDEIKQSGTLPLYLGFKDTWTCLAPWNALAVGLTDSDTCNQVNMGNTTFSDTYGPVAEKMRALLDYAEKNPYAYGYNDACTAFARGESAMYPIGSYAIPQIKSVNPDMNIGSFTFPANDEESDNVLNSGIDLQFSDCIIVTWDYVIQFFRITVCITDSDQRNSQSVCFLYTDSFFFRIYDEDRIRNLFHFFDSAKVLLQFFPLFFQLDYFFFRKYIKCSVFCHSLDVFQTCDTALDCLEVCQHST